MKEQKVRRKMSFGPGSLNHNISWPGRVMSAERLLRIRNDKKIGRECYYKSQRKTIKEERPNAARRQGDPNVSWVERH